ncbi:hypothetical protein [Clostridium fungisolvens]|uniref:Uncharacterized protein n=1 Tax=Clostridium fungisolvens TaxID=1604897 RepID=A0A6V8SMF2_9CLOT|nr:hypothetical protein [Clostridium fungisolvens]GFP77745.1 hypothetical protein bsdtw1_03916 [Clostridium fungisolvens]
MIKSLNSEVNIIDEELMVMELEERTEFGWWCTANACFGKIGFCLAVACLGYIGI